MTNDPLAFTRADFPLLRRLIDDRPLIHLDSASTAPKPQCVIDAVTEFYTQHSANVHRGVHVLSEESTEQFERARQEVASFLNASPSEIVFTRNSTEGINLVAHGLGLKPDDEVVITALEHHSNFMPWRVCARAVPVGLGPDGVPDYDEIHTRLSARTRLVALAQGLKHAGHDRAGRTVDRGGARSRHSRARGCLAERQPRAVGRPRDGLRLPRALRPQTARPVGRRRVCTASASDSRRCVSTRLAAAW